MVFALSLVGAGVTYIGAKRGLKYATGMIEPPTFEQSSHSSMPALTDIHPATLPIPSPTNPEARGAAEIPIILPPPPAQ
jgi:hypothetical protein